MRETVADGERPERDEWVHLQTFDSTLNANMARAFLEAEGIPCFLENEFSAGMGVAPTASLIVPLRLLVPASQLALAKKITVDAAVDPADEQEEKSGGAGRDRTAE